MKSAAKGLLYLLFLAIALVCFGRFRSEYSKSTAREASGDGRIAQAVAEDARDPVADAPAEATASPTNATAIATPPKDATTNAPAAAETNLVAKRVAPPAKAAGKGNAQAFYLSGFILGMLGLAGLMAWDVSQFVARKAAHGLGVDLAPIQGDPEYDAAEEAWANGDHLGAISLLRDFLKRHPNQQHAALRIAEIYEKDLGNHLAAALELEEVLQKRLPREKWGWTAIHLANLYSGKLNQTDKALGLLHRIVDTHPETSAARKARQRLGIPEPQEPAMAPRTPASIDQVPSPDASAPGEPAPAPEDDSLPKGFKTKKK